MRMRYAWITTTHYNIAVLVGKKRSLGHDNPSSSKNTKQQISVKTFEKWQGQFEKDHQTLSWLDCTKDQHDRSLVGLLLCMISKKYETKICSSKNFSNVYKYEINECEYLIIMSCMILDVDT